MRAVHTLFILLVSLLTHLSANAQVASKSLSYAQKTEYITLAKSGDAEALYQLGLSHLEGLNSAQNEAVAQRFFFYAAKKNHAKAKHYLSLVKNLPETPTKVGPSLAKTTTPPITNTLEPVLPDDTPIILQARAESEPYRGEKVLAALVDLSDNNSTTLSPLKDDIDRGLDEDINKTASAAHISNTASTAPTTTQESSLGTNILPRKTPNPQNPTGSITSFFLTIGSFLTIGLILLPAIYLFSRKILRQRQTAKGLPEGFNSRIYLALNPDVKSAGVNATHHYMNHGRFEGRRFN